MLLEFRIKNYKSFKDEVKFSAIPSYRGKNFEYSIFEEKIGKKVIKCLPTSVIYGANASGKTNLISAMETFKRIIKNGSITNTNFYYSNIAIGILELIPNYKLEKSMPVDFSIDFIENGCRIKYGISLDLGMFSQVEYDRKVLKEKLEINDVKIFERHENKVTIGNLGNISEINNNIKKDNNLSDSEVDDEKKILDLENETALLDFMTKVDNLDLFLCNNFRTNFCKNIYELIAKWIENKFIVVLKANNVRTNIPSDDTGEVESYIYKAAKIFGATSDKFVYIKDSENNKRKLCSVININNKNFALPSDIFESYGTNRIINLLPIISLIVKNGGTLVIDEFDASIHPMAIINIVNIFHNDDINVKKAQLIFNTHNPVFLRDTVFRRDEIKFTERNEEGYSSLYSLSDFKGIGKSSRKAKDYSEDYFVGRYGAVRDIDFSSIFSGEDGFK